MFVFRSIKKLLFVNRVLFLLIFVFFTCTGVAEKGAGATQNSSDRIAFDDSAFDELERKWISSSYFDKGMNYKNSRLEVVSFSGLLNSYGVSDEIDAILLNCADDYQGIVSVEDVRRYDLQLATKIELRQGEDRPGWLQPLLIVVPDYTSPPFMERFLTAHINELRFVRLADYYAPLSKVAQKGSIAKLGLKVLKDNCLFCHSINNVGGNKGGSLLAKFDFMLDKEKLRFKEAFLVKHGQDNVEKQNTKQFVTDSHLDALLKFMSVMIKG